MATRRSLSSLRISHELFDPCTAKRDAARAFSDAGTGPAAERGADIGAMRITKSCPRGLTRFKCGGRDLPFSDPVQFCGAVPGETKRLVHRSVDCRFLLHDAVSDFDLTGGGDAAFKSGISRSRIRRSQAAQHQRGHCEGQLTRRACRIKAAHVIELVRRNQIGTSWKRFWAFLAIGSGPPCCQRASAGKVRSSDPERA